MCAEYRFNPPLLEEQVRQLRLGDTVYLDGDLVIMAGNPTFERLLGYVKKGEDLPVDLKDAVVFNGPNVHHKAGDSYEMDYVGVTSSIRFEQYMPELIRKCGVRAVVGKGGLGEKSLKAMKEVGCVYLAVLGGATPLLSPAIKEVTSVHWLDLIHQYRLITVRVEGFGPATVAMDCYGNSTYENIVAAAEKKLPKILKSLSDFCR